MSERPAQDSGQEPEPTEPMETAAPADPEPEWMRRRRLARIFGDVLPDTTADERDERGERPRSSDDWLKSQVPPHHGG